MSRKRKLSFPDQQPNKKRKLNKKLFDENKCKKNIENEMKSLFQTNLNDNNNNLKSSAYYFCFGEMKVSFNNFFQIFIPQHCVSTIRYQGSNKFNNKIWKDLYESKDIINQSPVGIGNKTVIDKTLRSAKELTSSQFDLSGQSFEIHDSRTNFILKQVKDCLAPHASYINAIKYKLMIYGVKDFFSKHTDTYRASGNFGTLLLLLPTNHGGGEFVLSHNNNQKVFNNNCAQNQNQNIIKWIAFYGDIQHQVLPVIKGYRVSISYNLYLPSNTPQEILKQREWIMNPNYNRNLVDNICNIIINNNKKGVIFALNQLYVKRDMIVSRLKGQDLILYKAINGCSKLEFVIKEFKINRDEGDGVIGTVMYRNGYVRWRCYEETQEICDFIDDDPKYYVVIGDIYKNKRIRGRIDIGGERREVSYRCSVMIVTGNSAANQNLNDQNNNNNNNNLNSDK